MSIELRLLGVFLSFFSFSIFFNSESISMTANQLTTALIGSWNLLGWTTQSQDDASKVVNTHHPFGSNPSGLLIYSSDGFVSATVCRGNRTLFPQSVSPKAQSAEAKAEAFSSFFHYAGRWKISSGQVHHEVHLALNPNLVGTIQIRSPVFSEQGLTLEGLEPIGKLTRRHVIQWARPENAPLLLHPESTEGAP